MIQFWMLVKRVLQNIKEAVFELVLLSRLIFRPSLSAPYQAVHGQLKVF